MKRDFPEEWRMSLERIERNRYLSLPKGRLKIPGIGSVPRPHLVSTENLFDILLNFLIGIRAKNEFESEEARRKFNKAIQLYEQEVLTLIGTWRDEPLDFIANCREGCYYKVPAEEKSAYLKRLRKSSLASYF
jgi:hypothetical protein